MRLSGSLLTLWPVLSTFQVSESRILSTDTSKPPTTPSTCPARTINYITHTLPQSCLTTTWTSAESANIVHASPTQVNQQLPNETTTEPSLSSIRDDDAPIEPPDSTKASQSSSSFMSFEDWKEMMLRRTGQDPQDLKLRKPRMHGTENRIPPDSGHAGLGEEDEISLNFENLLEIDENRALADAARREEVAQGEDMSYEDREPPRSKDAGKTCKERFSYSSFDAGATILKTSPRAKNAKAILAENKDTYMLLECAAESKYVVVELSDDILVDTVVLANFEFFSSMIRHFRVSVSDRYPVKADKWRDLGTFEAKNSRDIQPFLVENPQIWAKYVRIDFLSHYGNEFYCPVSLIRVHGSRMLDSWKDTELALDEDMPTLPESTHQEPDEDKAEDINHRPAADLTPEHSTVEEVAPAIMTSRNTNVFMLQDATCLASPPPTDKSPEGHVQSGLGYDPVLEAGASVTQRRVESITRATEPQKTDGSVPTGRSDSPHPSPQGASVSLAHDRAAGTPISSPGAIKPGSEGSDPANSTRPIPSHSGGAKNRNIGASSTATASSTVQEGFFNAITKRLQQVESNLTLSLQYVEDQSRYIQEALQMGEQKQLNKVTAFLDNLNRTVLTELRSVRDQYDQIWQSTVIALESHRDQSERDMIALGTRLNLLADEVVFQKRMAIIQAILLLSCLFLVIFSRGVPIPYLAPLLEQGPGVFPYPNALPSPTYKHEFYAAQDEARHSDPGLGTTRYHVLSPTAEEDVFSQDRLDGSGRAASPADERHPLSSDVRSQHGAAGYLDIPASIETPNPHGEIARSSTPPSSREVHTADTRFPYSHKPHVRKPLPALPEHTATQIGSG
ncbi:UNC-like C-terminal-domain-containing protein [Stachybotrys elegans]|uniref:UNC-like C-terminal-domain-containing protein n=1 Tax=Stachybotrys elegans TaxID=80388 RepID=A0A8K0SCL0_9HYPO|nr:UNC-like C-terminal-domain-containing protein [Stachybotrys elegans]